MTSPHLRVKSERLVEPLGLPVARPQCPVGRSLAPPVPGSPGQRQLPPVDRDGLLHRPQAGEDVAHVAEGAEAGAVVLQHLGDGCKREKMSLFPISISKFEKKAIFTRQKGLVRKRAPD